MSMQLFECTFITTPLDDEQYLKLLERYDVVEMSQLNYSSTTVLVGDTEEFSTAVIYAIDALKSVGVTVHNFEPDLVHLSEGARRLGITKQTLGEHARKHTFPQPFTTSPVTAWLWFDLAQWSIDTGNGNLEDLNEYRPNRHDVATAMATTDRPRTDVIVSYRTDNDLPGVQLMPDRRAYDWADGQALGARMEVAG